MEKPAPEYQQILTSQTIDDDGPGTVLRDFETLLDFIGSAGTAVSNTNNLLPLKSLGPLNARLTHPLELGLKRPQQRSYPHISALYLLLRATGLGRVEGTGNKQRLVLDDAILASWRQLNPTERYSTLLETWLLRVNPEIIGEHSFRFRPPITSWHEFFQRIPAQGLRIAGDRRQEETVTVPYFPGLINLAMFELFALVTVQHGKPQSGQGWRIIRVKRTPWGEALLHVLSPHLLSMEFLVQHDPSIEANFGELQDILQPFFPAWQHNLELPVYEFHDGVYVFKVSWGRIWRRIAIPGTHAVDSLSDAILEAYAFDHDHLYEFAYKNRFGQFTTIHHPYMEEPPSTTEVRIGDIPLQPGTTMTYLYDFGDRWAFDVRLERIDPLDRRLRNYKILEAHGEAPEQYPNWDGWDDDAYWDDAEENEDA